MKRIAIIVAGFATVVLGVGLMPSPAVAGGGNGAPSGAHYNLNIIGVPKNKTADLTGDNGHRIFVNLNTAGVGVDNSDHINLVQSFDGTFGVLDANGTDGNASFKLPAPGTYQIWARALGAPGGWAKVLTCATDLFTHLVVCTSADQTNYIYTAVRNSGKSSFQNVTDALTTISLDAPITCNDGTTTKSTISLFDPCLNLYFWQYLNHGLRLMQVRFYKVG